MSAQTAITKAELLAEMQAGWDQLDAYLDTLSEAQATIPTDAGGWSIKDHVIHIAVWEGSMIDYLQKKPRWAYMGVSQATWQDGGIDAINAEIDARNKDLTWAEVRHKFRRAHYELVGRIEAFSDADLQRPYNYYQPESDQTHPTAYRLGNASYRHYVTHRPWIEALAANGS